MRRKVIFLLVVILLTAGTEAAFAGQSVTEPQENNFVTEYQVSPGDSLTAIAKRHEMDWELVAAMNNIDNPNKIYPGQQLFLPVMQQDHVVVGHGDTLWAIAQKFEVNVSDLAFENAIENPNALEAGMRLRIPSMPAIPTFLQDEVVPALSSRGATDFFYPGL